HHVSESSRRAPTTLGDRRRRVHGGCDMYLGQNQLASAREDSARQRSNEPHGGPEQLSSQPFRSECEGAADAGRTWGRQATLTSTSWMPAPDGATTASPLPTADNARSVQEPGAAKNRKSPVADATTSAVNSSDESSRRTNAPPTAWPSRSTTRPVITVSFSRSTLAGSVSPCFGPEHISASQLDRGAHEGAVFRPTAVVVLDIPMSEQFLQNEPGVRGSLPDSAVRNRFPGAVQARVGVDLGQLFVRLEGA